MRQSDRIFAVGSICFLISAMLMKFVFGLEDGISLIIALQFFELMILFGIMCPVVNKKGRQ